ncbi:MAG: tRNA (adenosine(37)-N6)-threonylcarbamoyltransferase complex ATPase subunit type 1 TsaE [Luteolibacter sp.]
MNQRATTEEEMMELGRKCGAKASSGAVWCLIGDLGTGKTHWTKGFVQGVGCSATVTSPTFGLVHEYRGGRTTVFHFDFYRIESAQELLSLGWDDYLERDGIVVVEWAEKYPHLLPAGAIKVTIDTQGDASRLVEWNEPFGT